MIIWLTLQIVEKLFDKEITGESLGYVMFFSSLELFVEIALVIVFIGVLIVAGTQKYMDKRGSK